MSSEQCNAEQEARSAQQRRSHLLRARDLMAAALALLDENSHSPAAATLDLAVHHLDAELAD